ncbi:MAG: lipopolysaccharide export system ATP-binding protein [Candidatus Sumerlaeota bacterium]|nr:lipopolysaccharide export system ATP-binding protein [Candidatus Sumerlaeota bacterium]
MEKLEIRTSSLVKEFGNRRVVDGVSISVKTGEIVGLLGPNGAGKTTTFKMIVGFERPTKGKVYFGERDITSKPIHERARLGVSYLAQETSVFRKMTVRDNLKAILEAHRVPRAEIRTRIDKLEEELGIGHLRRQKAETLSGGEMRRVEIARALTTNPKFIFLDEPFAGIDPKTIEDLQIIIAQLRDRGLGVLITDHNVRETLHITDRSYILLSGVVTVSGSVDEIAQNEQIRSQYITDRIVRDLEAERSHRANLAKTTEQEAAPKE